LFTPASIVNHAHLANSSSIVRFGGGPVALFFSCFDFSSNRRILQHTCARPPELQAASTQQETAQCTFPVIASYVLLVLDPEAKVRKLETTTQA